ncbi:MAG: hypothetical protein J0L99_09165 [Chitinophagales bacterium]|nr:hypothetical protein [Chitinophagales bacterium]
MRQIRIFVSLLLIAAAAGKAYNQASSGCPTTIGYSATDCKGVAQAGFYMNFPPGPYQGGQSSAPYDAINIQINNCWEFSSNVSPYWKYCNIPNSAHHYYFIFNTQYSCTQTAPTGKIIFDDSKTCYYENGNLICNDELALCGDAINAFAEDYLAFDSEPKKCSPWEGSCDKEGEIYRMGTVMIGCTQSGRFGSGAKAKLAVKGGIVTEFLKLCTTEWCDYVFEDNYKLMSLPSTAQYIRNHKALPGSITEAEVKEEGGLLLDQTVRTQQVHIEEAYLHLLQMSARLDALEKQRVFRKQKKLASVATAAQNTYVHFPEPVPAITIQCSQLVAAQAGIPGTGGIIIQNGVAPYSISWSGNTGSGQLSNVSCQDMVLLPNLSSGLYNVVVTGSNGNTTSCSLAIGTSLGSPCELVTNPTCKTALIETLKANQFTTPSYDCVQWGKNDCSTTAPIFRTGIVGIGTTNIPSGYNLAVQGGIISDKIRIELCDSKWCDYVFAEYYQLMPLKKVKKFISTNKYLPGIPSQAAITQEGGIELKSMKLAQQVKIEEAYLHLLELERRKQALKAILEDNNH